MVSGPFAALVGQTQAIELLTRAVEQRQIAPAYLFAGPEGVGRRVAATCFLSLLLQPVKQTAHNPQALQQRIRDRNHPDLLWIEPTYLHQGRRIAATEAEALGLKRKAPPQIRLDQIRDIAQFLSRPPLEAARSVVVVEQAESMAESAANGLLKTLEEPGQATLVLIAPDGNALLPTLVSRCQRIPFQRLSETDLVSVLQQAEHTDLLQHSQILALAQGSPGQAIASWQQIQAIPPDLLSQLQSRPTSLRQALDLAREIDAALDSETQLWLVDYLQHCYWHLAENPVLTEVYPLKQLEQARRQLLSYVQPRLVWEVALMTLTPNSGLP